MDRMLRFLRHSLGRSLELGHSLELRHNRIRMKPFQRHSLGLRRMLVLRMDHSLIHNLNCKIVCPSGR